MEGTKTLWREVFVFVAERYDEEVLEKIYINGDGADWIRAGAGMHAKARFVLERFHMHKYIISIFLYLLISLYEMSIIWLEYYYRNCFKEVQI